MALISLRLQSPEKRSNLLENPALSLNQPANWEWITGGHETDAGELITEHTAMKISTVYTCVRVLSESVASLPVRLLRVTPQGRVQDVENPLAQLLSVAPNSEMSSFVFFEVFTHYLSLTGNAYAEIQRDRDGTPVHFGHYILGKPDR